MRVHRDTWEACGREEGSKPPHARLVASRAALCLAASSATGVAGLPDGLIVNAALAWVPQEVEATAVFMKASLDCRIALRDKPGGEGGVASFPAGVLGIVPSAVPSKRHGCPLSAVVLCSQSPSDPTAELVVRLVPSLVLGFWLLRREASSFILASKPLRLPLSFGKQASAARRRSASPEAKLEALVAIGLELPHDAKARVSATLQSSRS